MTSPLKLKVILGSTRSGRRGEAVSFQRRSRAGDSGATAGAAGGGGGGNGGGGGGGGG